MKHKNLLQKVLNNFANAPWRLTGRAIKGLRYPMKKRDWKNVLEILLDLSAWIRLILEFWRG
jgi:hypothetical protein